MPEKILLLSLIAGLSGVWLNAAEAAAKVGTPKIYKKLLILGNSLTRHGPSTEKLGWSGNWGMAATALEKDYAHQFQRLLAESQGGVVPELKTVSVLARDFPPDYQAFTPRDKKEFPDVAALADWGADLIVVQCGDNLQTATEANFAQPYAKLVQALKTSHSPTVLCCSTWWNKPTHIEMIKKICAETGAIFVSIYELEAQPENNALAEGHFSHPGVAAHPGDQGMAAIATKLMAAMPKN